MTIEQLLDTLAEYQAQADYLEMKKQELINEVKIPAEVLAAQDQANKRRLWARQKLGDRLKAEQLAEVKDPEIPPEFAAAIEAARKQRADISTKFFEKNEADRQATETAKDAINAELTKSVEDVYKAVAVRKQEISSEFSEKAGAVLDNIAKLKARIVEEVKAAAKSIKGSVFHAVYVKGRVTWNTDMLDGMIVAFPALEKARKVGEPSVTIRKI
jgi:hypothetical protein